jgi:tetratricopeptide (TPR) repeat protein
MRITTLAGYGVLVTMLAGTSATAQESLASARELYAAAAYEDALALLNRLRPAAPTEGRAIEQYRAFCLLALGRGEEAERSIEAIIAAEPGYEPSAEEVSPRVRTAFADVRRRMLPAIIQEKYATAKASYDRKNWKDAARGFKEVLDVLNDPAARAVASQPALADLRTLSAGFYDLSVAALVPPPQPVTVPEPAAAVAAPAVVAPPPASKVYTAQDFEVIPPRVVKQVLPPFPSKIIKQPGKGALELLINEQGEVEAAAMTASVHPNYDPLALAAAKTFKYKPATRDGVPVKYRKLLNIALQAR